MESKKALKFCFEGKNVGASHDSTILEALNASTIIIDQSCGGNGSCGTCLVVVEKSVETNRLPPRNEIENEMAESRNLGSHERLACQTPAVEGLVLKRAF